MLNVKTDWRLKGSQVDLLEFQNFCKSCSVDVLIELDI